MSVDLLLYYLGTDNGNSFSSENANTSPTGIITKMTSAVTDTDFVNGIHNASELNVATMVFTRLN